MVVMTRDPLPQLPTIKFQTPLRNVLLGFTTVLCKKVVIQVNWIPSLCHHWQDVYTFERVAVFWPFDLNARVSIHSIIVHCERLNRGCRWFGKAGTQLQVREWRLWSARFGAWVFILRVTRRCWMWETGRTRADHCDSSAYSLYLI